MSHLKVMGPPSYMRSIVDRNVVMRRIPVLGGTKRREAPRLTLRTMAGH